MQAEPNTTSSSSELDSARRAFGSGRWAEAVELFTAADAVTELAPHDLDALGEASWWIGRLDRSIEARERSYAAHTRSGDARAAAASALALANDHSHRLASSTAAGWVSRAERLLEGIPVSPTHGYLERARLNGALGRGALDQALEHAQRVLDIGTTLKDRDLEALGLHDKGRVLVAQGRVEEGLALLDEAMVAAVSGDVSPYATAVVYCNGTVACQDLADFRRAGEWADAAKRWCERQSITGFPGMCRVRRAEITSLRGAWVEAEAEARRACEELETFCLDYAGEGFYQIAEIRMRSGDLPGAEEAFRRAHELGRDPEPGLAYLRLAEGNTTSARQLIDAALGNPAAAPLRRARLLPALVEIAIAQKEVSVAEAAAAEQTEIANSYGSTALHAMAACSNGLVLLARGDSTASRAQLARGLTLWQSNEAPYEVARARVALSEALQLGGQHAAAEMEMRAALAAFERLGAVADASAARERLAAPIDAGTRGARQTATFVFTDIVRSTNLIEAIGDDAWEDLLAWHDTAVRELIATHGGDEIHHAGDGFFVAFGEAERAVAFAIAVQRRFADHRRRQGFAPSVRIGLHSAEAIRRRDGYEGKAVHLAARIGALAGADEILASCATLDALPDRPAVDDERAVELRGIREPVQVAQLQWREERPAQAR